MNKIKIVNLKCGYHRNPNQIPRENVCFSWGTEGAGPQKGYRLQISHDENFKAIYVDTQKELSSLNKFIKVKAKLSRATKYYWRVKVYTEDGSEEWSDIQSFETKHKGFDAQWITPIKERDPESLPRRPHVLEKNSIPKDKYIKHAFMPARRATMPPISTEKNAAMSTSLPAGRSTATGYSIRHMMSQSLLMKGETA